MLAITYVSPHFAYHSLAHEPILLSNAYYCQGKYAEAEVLYKRCQAIREKVLGPEHPDLASTLQSRASLLHTQVTAGRGSGSVVNRGGLQLSISGSVVGWSFTANRRSTWEFWGDGLRFSAALQVLLVPTRI